METEGLRGQLKNAMISTMTMEMDVTSFARLKAGLYATQTARPVGRRRTNAETELLTMGNTVMTAI